MSIMCFNLILVCALSFVLCSCQTRHCVDLPNIIVPFAIVINGASKDSILVKGDTITVTNIEDIKQFGASSAYICNDSIYCAKHQAESKMNYIVFSIDGESAVLSPNTIESIGDIMSGPTQDQVIRCQDFDFKEVGKHIMEDCKTKYYARCYDYKVEKLSDGKSIRLKFHLVDLPFNDLKSFGERYISNDINFKEGNSGGPVFSKDGMVIGLISNYDVMSMSLIPYKVVKRFNILKIQSDIGCD